MGEITDYKHRFVIYLILLAILIALGFILTLVLKQPKGQTKRQITLNECYLYQMNIPFHPKTQVLGTLVDGELAETRPLLYDIIKCESNFNPSAVNQKYGSGSGIGLGQLTKVAIEDCEKNLKKRIDPYNAEENLECCLWLYETYGTDPWGTPTSSWGSYNCWGK